MPERTVASWTAMISGYCNNGLADEGLTTFVQMLENEYPNEFTLAAALQIVAENCNSRFTCILHGYIIKGGFLEDSFLQNSLISAYAKSGILSEAVKLLERCCFLDFCYFRFCVTWIRARSGYGFLQDARRWGCTQRGRYLNQETMATLLQCCGHSNNLKLGKQLHGYLIKHGFSSCMVQNSLINMYAENEQNESAFQVFARMTGRDIVSWNSLITCLIKNGEFHEALQLPRDIHCNGGEMRPDFITMLALIQACSNLSSLMPGKVIHGQAGFSRGNLEGMPMKDLGSWNSLIAAYGIKGNGRLPLQAFTKLNKSSPHKPSAITFTNILSACSHEDWLMKATKSSRACRKNTEWNREWNILFAW
ncbi:hypothetical protein V6N12_076314 [Hibiscus sabdariffa]|uniref:Pentatricopeptide repeat-containing protein n=1 Tax=Hibiscus sabdariffa TaxID=183260 RepID=A0ABR2D9E8_9ROSI